MNWLIFALWGLVSALLATSVVLTYLKCVGLIAIGLWICLAPVWVPVAIALVLFVLLFAYCCYVDVPSDPNDIWW